MAAPVQLDKAAAMVGKSEVTLRRLIKAGKIPFTKEKTLTGFIYMVDPEVVRNFYTIRGSIIEDVIGADSSLGESESAPVSESQSVRQAVRVAVAGESGEVQEYWQKKSDLYEEKYNKEVERHSQTREELGVWRGRAEQTQSMLMKVLPAPREVEVRQTPQEPIPVIKADNTATVVALTVLSVLILIAILGFAYFQIAAQR